MRNSKILLLSIPIIFLIFNSFSNAEDWPMWRYDAGRTAFSKENLENNLHLQWTLNLTKREPVWDDPLNQDLMQYDRIFEPIVLGNILYIGFNDCDKVAAYDLQTGEQLWQFFANGPVRLPIAGWEEKIYFNSDDGYTYCVSAIDGKLIWKFNGAPTDQRLLGNKRIISTWPARGGVVIKDNIVYFANSIWPMMGTFIYALNANSGKVIWRNEETSANFINQPHNYPAFAGIAPQGAFAINGEDLLIPGGRSVPACFTSKTGKKKYYHLARYGKTGGAFLSTSDTIFFNHHRDRMTHMYSLNSGKIIVQNAGKYPVISNDMFYFSGSTVSARSKHNPKEVLWEVNVDATGDLIMVGDYLYAAGNNLITKLQPSKTKNMTRQIWQKSVNGNVSRLIAANGHLIAVTEKGKILVYSSKNSESAKNIRNNVSFQMDKEIDNQSKSILDIAKVYDGYSIFYGIGNGDLLAAIAKNSNLSIIGIEPDINKINQLRNKLDNMNLYGKRISLINGNIESVNLPKYFSSLTIVNNYQKNRTNFSKTVLSKLQQTARPYDGKVWISTDNKDLNLILINVMENPTNQFNIENHPTGILLTRDKALPESDNWTQQYGDIQNSVKSDDKQVKMPLGILWFGGNSNLDVLPRHGHGPPEQVVDGRLIIEGMDCISARDVYTGRVLWKTPLDSMATFQMYFNESYKNTPLEATYNQRHIPGANGRGTNYIASKDYVYVIQGPYCLVIDIINGKVVKKFHLPEKVDSSLPDWGYLGVYKNYLIAGSDFAKFSKHTPLTAKEKNDQKELTFKRFTDLRDKTNYDLTASKKLLIMDRYSGEVKWEIESLHGFIHNSIVIYNNQLFCIDKIPSFIEGKMERRALELPTDYQLLSLNINNGKINWKKNKNVFGSWLGYSKENALLLQATRPSSDMLYGEEGERMIMYEADSGNKIWDKAVSYNNPPILHTNKIITEHIALDIFSGEQIQRVNPISLELLPWTYTRTKGCNYNIASENLLSFRTSAAGFFDLANDGGVGHFGGFKSGCTSNLIAANGVLNAPDYTRTCQCAYQNQTSLAMVHMPEVEYWTTSDYNWNGNPVKKIGINLNAPGDRMAPNNIMWLDYPSIGGPSPDIPIKMIADNPIYIRRHSSFLPNCNILPWVSASAIVGLESLEITLSDKTMDNKTYSVKLHFTELEEIEIGERIFDISIQGKIVLKDLDIVKEAGQREKDIVKIIDGISVKDKLIISFSPSKKSPKSLSIISGIEIISDEL